MKKCLLIISPSVSDFGGLVGGVDNPELWRRWSRETSDVLFVVAERVFNEKVLSQLSGYGEIFVAYHLGDVNIRPHFSSKMRVRVFSRQTADPIWSPHILDLINYFKRPSSSDYPNDPDASSIKATIDRICTLVLDREGLFLKRSIQCLARIYEEALKDPPSADKIRSICQDQLDRKFFDDLGVPFSNRRDIEFWMKEVSALGSEGLLKLSKDLRLARVRNLRNILLGDDGERPNGIVHLLKDETRGRLPV